MGFSAADREDTIRDTRQPLSDVLTILKVGSHFRQIRNITIPPRELFIMAVNLPPLAARFWDVTSYTVSEMLSSYQLFPLPRDPKHLLASPITPPQP